MIIKSKIPVSADFHVDKSRSSAEQALNFFIDFCTERQAEVLLGVIAGDLFHRREVVQVGPGARFVKKMRQRAGTTPEIVGLPGNHDYESDTEEAGNALDVLSGCGLVVVERPFLILPLEIIVDEQGSKEAFHLVFLPFEPDATKLKAHVKAILSRVDDPKRTVLFGHQPLKGAVTRGITIDSPYDADLFKKFRRVYFGDIHDRQKVGPVQYVGAPLEHDFGDAEKPRGFLVYDILQDTEEWIEIPGMPEHYNVNFQANTALALHEGADTLSWTDADTGQFKQIQYGKQTRIKLRPAGSEAAIAALDLTAVVKQLREAGAHVQLEPQPVLDTPQRLEIEPRKLSDLPEVLKAFIEQSTTTLDKAWLAELGAKLLPASSVEDAQLETIVLQDITMEGFGSWKYVKFAFDNGLHSIIGQNLDEGGSNGSGKSNLLNGLKLCLYGDTQQEISADDYINWEANGYQLKLRLHATAGDYEIVRRRQRGKSSEAVLKLNGTEVYNKVPQVNEAVVQLLRMDSKLFDHVIFMAQEGNYSFADETDGQQRELLTAILPGLDKLDAALTKAKDMHKQGETVLQAHQNSLIEARSARTTVAATDYAADISAFEQDRQRKAVEWDQRALEYQTAAEQLNSRLPALRAVPPPPDSSAELSNVEAVLAQETQLLSIETQWRNYLTQVTAQQLTSKQALHTLEQKIARAQQQPTGNPCDSCGQLITPSSVEQHIAHWVQEQEPLHTALQAANTQIATAQKTLQEVAERRRLLQTYHEKKSELLQQRAKWEADCAALAHQLRQLETELAHQQEFMTTAQQNAQQERARVNPYVGLQEQKQAKLEELEQAIREGTDKVERDKAGLQYADWMIEAFGPKGIRVFLFDQFVGTLAGQINSFIGDLFDGVYVTISTTKATQAGAIREKLDVQIWRNGKRLPLGRFSGGEQRLIRLAINLSVAFAAQERLRTSIGLLVLDEAFENLDNFRVERVGTALENLTRKVPMIYMVAHNLTLQNQTTNRIVVRKQNGVSYLGAA